MHETLREWHYGMSLRAGASWRPNSGRIEQLRIDGRDATASEILLARYERSLAIFEDDLKRIEEKKK